MAGPPSSDSTTPNAPSQSSNDSEADSNTHPPSPDSQTNTAHSPTPPHELTVNTSHPNSHAPKSKPSSSPTAHPSATSGDSHETTPSVQRSRRPTINLPRNGDRRVDLRLRTDQGRSRQASRRHRYSARDLTQRQTMILRPYN